MKTQKFWKIRVKIPYSQKSLKKGEKSAKCLHPVTKANHNSQNHVGKLWSQKKVHFFGHFSRPPIFAKMIKNDKKTRIWGIWDFGLFKPSLELKGKNRKKSAQIAFR